MTNASNKQHHLSTTSMSRKEKVRLIAERDLERQRKGRLKSVLVQKLEVKHGKRSSKPLKKSEVNSLVKDYLEQNEAIVKTADVRKIDDVLIDISKYINNFSSSSLGHDKNNNALKMKPSSSSSLATKESSSSSLDSVVQVAKPSASSSTTLTEPKKKVTICQDSDYDNKKSLSKHHPTIVTTEKIQGSISLIAPSRTTTTTGHYNTTLSGVNPWTVLDTFQAVKAEEVRSAEKEKDANDRREMVKVLNDQVAFKKTQEDRNKRIDQTFIAAQAQELQRWREGQEKTRLKEKEKTLRLKNQRQQQIDMLSEQKKLNKALQQQQDLKEIEYAKRQIEKEAREKIDKKMQERANWEIVKKEQRQRQEDHTDLHFNMKTQRDFQAKEKRDLEREAKKKEMWQTQMKEITAYNKEMAEEKKLLQQRQEQEEKDYFIKRNLDREAAIISEVEAKRKKKTTGEKRYCKLLQDQIDSLTLRQKDIVGMTDVEKSINRKSIENIENDVVLRDKIVEKLALRNC